MSVTFLLNAYNISVWLCKNYDYDERWSAFKDHSKSVDSPQSAYKDDIVIYLKNYFICSSFNKQSATLHILYFLLSNTSFCNMIRQSLCTKPLNTTPTNKNPQHTLCCYKPGIFLEYQY